MTKIARDEMKVFAIIPARYGSERFPGKPLAKIADIPMIQHVYERARACPELEQIWVATDDQRIVDCVEGFGGKAIMTNKDHPSGTDRIREAALLLGLSKEDLVVNIQGDQPLFPPELVSQLVEPFSANDSIAMTTLARPLTSLEDAQNPNHVKVVVDAKGFAIYFSRAPIPYYRDHRVQKNYLKHIGMYSYKVWFLEEFSCLPRGELERAEMLEQLRALENGYKIKVVETQYNSLDVDVPHDIKLVQEALANP